jgi:hypothetical protein
LLTLLGSSPQHQHQQGRNQLLASHTQEHEQKDQTVWLTQKECQGQIHHENDEEQDHENHEEACPEVYEVNLMRA